MIGSVIYKVSERNMRRVMLLELKEKWREKTDREIVRLSENHILLKRKHSRKKKYRIREKCRSPEKETTQTTIKEKITETRVQIVIQREKREMSKDKEKERSLEKEIESEKVGGVRKKVVSPNIQKIREVFEKSEKVIPEKEKKGEKVSRLRNGFELMMDDTETRKKKFEMKKKRNKIVGLKGTPCKSTIDKWVGGGGLRKVEVIENEIGSVRKLSVSDKTKSGSKSVNKISKASQILSKQVKVEYTTPESKHRKDVAIEKTIFIKKFENIQKEDLNSKKSAEGNDFGKKS